MTSSVRTAGQGDTKEAGIATDRSAVDAWFAEARRLFDEAEERLAAGSALSALSSLVAVPPLHRMIMNRCSELLDDTADEVSDDDESPGGLYL